MKTILVFHIACFIAVFLDAWSDSLVIKNNKRWHTTQMLLLGSIGMFVVYLWFFPDRYYLVHKPGAEMLILPLIYLTYRLTFFNLIVNYFMKWDWWFLGTTSWFDRNLRGFWRVFTIMTLIVFTIYFTTFFLG